MFAAALAFAGVLNLTSCSGAGVTTASPATTAAPASAYATIADLDKALVAAGIPCTLEYAGLKDDVSRVELSICTIDAEQAYLRVWQDTTLLRKFLASPEGATGTVAVGANWTITVVSNATATKIARAIGGTAPTTSTAGSTPKP